jgi:hypothetical protein
MDILHRTKARKATSQSILLARSVRVKNVTLLRDLAFQLKLPLTVRFPTFRSVVAMTAPGPGTVRLFAPNLQSPNTSATRPIGLASVARSAVYL